MTGTILGQDVQVSTWGFEPTEGKMDVFKKIVPNATCMKTLQILGSARELLCSLTKPLEVEVQYWKCCSPDFPGIFFVL